MIKSQRTSALRLATAIMILGFGLSSCKKKTETASPEHPTKGAMAMEVKKEVFGVLPSGKTVDIFTLINAGGIEARVMAYGATLVSLNLPDREEKFEDVTLGFDCLAGYLGDNPYFGCTVGRYANRIARGKFFLAGAEYTLAKNDGENHLHGGLKGFDKVIWEAEPVEKEDAVGVRFTYLSPDMEEGYPGNLHCTVVYLLTEGNELRISYEAEADKPTPVNLTNHTYWNLAAQGSGDILKHELMINAETYTPVDDKLIPTGELAPVQGTPMDFTTPHSIGERLSQVKGGYDHNYVLRSKEGELSLAARVHEPNSGRILEILTTEPGIQFYSGNFLDGTIRGKGGNIYHLHAGFCLETQHFPDSPNKPHFPSTSLAPGKKYVSLTVHKFFVR